MQGNWTYRRERESAQHNYLSQQSDEEEEEGKSIETCLRKKKKNPLKMTKKKKKKWEDLIASAVTSYTRLLPVLFLVADSLMVRPAAAARQKRQERERREAIIDYVQRSISRQQSPERKWKLTEAAAAAALCLPCRLDFVKTAKSQKVKRRVDRLGVYATLFSMGGFTKGKRHKMERFEEKSPNHVERAATIHGGVVIKWRNTKSQCWLG